MGEGFSKHLFFTNTDVIIDIVKGSRCKGPEVSLLSGDIPIKDLNTNYYCKQVVFKRFGLRTFLLCENYSGLQRAFVFTEYTYQK